MGTVPAGLLRLVGDATAKIVRLVILRIATYALILIESFNFFVIFAVVLPGASLEVRGPLLFLLAGPVRAAHPLEETAGVAAFLQVVGSAAEEVVALRIVKTMLLV